MIRTLFVDDEPAIQAVVSDYDMPGMDGIALLKAVRARDADLPFILLTGRGREEVVIEALNHGADFYLQKSAEPRALYAELVSKIRHAVDRQRARKALVRTQFSIDHLPAEFYWIDRKGGLIDVNEFACRKLGYTRDELFATRILDVDSDFDIEGFEEAWQEAWQDLKEHQTLSMESHHRKRDGTVYPVELSLSHCRMGDKEFMCAFATDISDRERADAAVKEEKERLGTILSAMDSGLSVMDPECTIVWANQKVRDLFPGHDPVGQKSYQLFEQRDRPCQPCPVQQAFSTGEVQNAEKYSSAHGRWYSVVAQPVRGPSGAVVQVLLSFTDITEQKQVEQHLRESREQYHQWICQSPQGTVIHSQGTVIYCNQTAAEILGAEDGDEVIGRPLFEFIHPDFHDIAMQRMEKILHDSDIHLAPHIEVGFIRMDGSFIDVEVSAGPVTFEGRPAFQVVFQDITERKQAEKERLTLKQQLEAEIRDLNLLHTLSTRYLEGDDFDTLLQEILEAAITITGADKGNVQLLDPETGMLMIVAQKNFKRPFLEFFAYVDAGDATACGAALEQAERVVVVDICESPVFDEETAAVLLAEDLHAVQSTPLVSRTGHLLGIISTHFCRVHAPAERELRHIDILARQASDMIERKWAEERLAKSEKKYRHLVENANSIILKLDNRGYITFFNEFAQQFFGYSLDEILGKNAVGTIVPERETSGRSLRTIILDICAHPEQYRIHENENITKEGRKVWIQWTNRVIFDEHGRATEVLCIGDDITGQKRAEERMRESETKYRSLFESSLDGILIADLNGRFTDANQSALDMLGYTAEELTGLNFWQITPECWHATEADTLDDILTRGHSDLYEKEYVRKDGTVIPINIRAWLMRDDAGTPVGMWAIVRDINAQKQAEKVFRESEQRLNLAIEAAYLGVWDKNLVAGEVVTHGYWPGILGYASVEDVPPWEETVHPDDRNRVLHELHTHMDKETSFVKTEYRMQSKDGRYRWIQSRGKVAERDADGRPVRMIGVDHDITPLHASRESLKEANRKLNLLSSITRHDILNQISAQKAFLALLEEYIPQESEAQGFYEHLVATSETIRKQIAFTGDYQYMGEREPEWLQVEWVVRRAAESVRLNGTRLEVSTPLPEVFADPMLEKAIANLLDNATAHGNGITAIRISFQHQNGDGVIVLEDDGVGVPAAQKEEIFDRGVGKNTGLGLFLTREILGITGISIRECGEEGKGARFVIAVPKGKWREFRG
jgi:PAS domain S-box-containing protein